MRVGILGSGLMGGKLGTIFARARHEVVFSYVCSEQKFRVLALDAKGKARAGTPREAAQEADVVLLAVHWSRIKDVLNQTGDLSGKVIVTCSLPMNDDNTELVSTGKPGYFAIAISEGPKSRIIGWSGPLPSADAAKKEAIENCKKRGGTDPRLQDQWKEGVPGQKE